ncbi:hypothetical protein LDENG_00177440 [Lucifuga dentata]|nr:hypothetical protein LDENG_00177440 [Lucifuga dentata]
MNSEVLETSYLFKFKQARPNSAGAPSYSKTTIPNVLLKQQRRFSELKDGRFLTGQVSHLI